MHALVTSVRRHGRRTGGWAPGKRPSRPPDIRRWAGQSESHPL